MLTLKQWNQSKMCGDMASHLSKRKEDNDRDVERWEMDILPDSINNVAAIRTVIIIIIIRIANIMIMIVEQTVQTGHRIMIKISRTSY